MYIYFDKQNKYDNFKVMSNTSSKYMRMENLKPVFWTSKKVVNTIKTVLAFKTKRLPTKIIKLLINTKNICL